MSTFPSIISTISTPTATDKLNSPSHSSIEAGQNDGIKKLETFVGTLSSTAGTLIYDIRATASDGGGHIQGANKGGTGQTAYTKGDVLVARSASVLSKISIGSDNQVLTADSNQNSGVKWAGVANAIDIQNQTYTYAKASVHSASVYGVVLNQAVSVLSDGLGLVVKFPTANTTSVVALTVNAQGPSSLTALVKNTAIGNLAINEIKASMIGVLEFDSVSSVFQMVSPAPLIVKKTGTTTKNTADASSVQSIAHGLGTTPKLAMLMCAATNASNNVNWANAVYDGTTQASQSAPANASGNPIVGATFTLSILDSANDKQVGVITYDATNIIITWTKTGTPTGTYQILWEASS